MSASGDSAEAAAAEDMSKAKGSSKTASHVAPMLADAEMDADGSDDGEGGRDAYPEDFSDSEEEKEDYTIR